MHDKYGLVYFWNRAKRFFQIIGRTSEVLFGLIVLLSILSTVIFFDDILEAAELKVSQTDLRNLPCRTNLSVNSQLDIGPFYINLDNYNETCATYQSAKLMLHHGMQLLEMSNSESRQAGADLYAIGLGVFKETLPKIELSMNDYLEFSKINKDLLKTLADGDDCSFSYVTVQGKSGMAYLCH